MMKKSRKSARKKLDPEENKLLSSFERDEWKTIANVKKEKLRARKMAEKPDEATSHRAPSNG